MLVPNFTVRHAPLLHWSHTWGPGGRHSQLCHDYHGTLSWLYTMKTTFISIWIAIFQKKSGCRQWKWQSVAVVPRPDKMWNKIPFCPLGLTRAYIHGPNHWITNFDQLLYRHNWLSTQPPVNSASSPMHCSWIHGLVHGLDTKH